MTKPSTPSDFKSLVSNTRSYFGGIKATKKTVCTSCGHTGLHHLIVGQRPCLTGRGACNCKKFAFPDGYYQDGYDSDGYAQYLYFVSGQVQNNYAQYIYGQNGYVPDGYGD